MGICFLSCILPQLFALKAFRVVFSFDALNEGTQEEGLLLAPYVHNRVPQLWKYPASLYRHTLIPSIHVPLLSLI